MLGYLTSAGMRGSVCAAPTQRQHLDNILVITTHNISLRKIRNVVQYVKPIIYSMIMYWNWNMREVYDKKTNTLCAC